MAGKSGVTHGIVRYLLKNIEDGTWAVGDQIPSENALSRELGASRVSVRNALQQFTALGVLESIHGKGTYLISDDISAFEAPEQSGHTIESISELHQILEFRAMVEPQICERVAMNADPELISRLKVILNTMRNSVGKSKVFVEADQQFHLEICNAHGNAVVSEIMSSTFKKRAEPHYMLSLANGFYGGIYYHGLLIDALEKHDDKRARSLMLEHLQHGLEDLHSGGVELPGWT